MTPLEVAIRATPGVVSVFSLTETDAAVSVSIGVAAGDGAAATAAAVARGIRSLVSGATVAVRVSRVA